MFNHYFTEVLKWGYSHDHGETSSTNGLEKGWDYFRKEVNRVSSKNPHRDPSKLSSVLTTIQHWSFRPCNRPFAIAPVQSMTDWDTIDAMRASKGLSSDFRLMICYDLKTNNVVDNIPFHLHKRCSSMVCFLPSVSVTEYCAMQYDMAFSNPTGHSRPAQLTGVNRTTKWYHNKLERRHYMATVFELLKGEYGYLLFVSSISSVCIQLQLY